MAAIESNKVSINNSSDKIFTFLSDLNNFEKLMPEGKVTDWESTNDTCQFKVQGMGKLGMKIKSTEPNNKLVLESLSEKPFPFELTITIEEETTDNVKVQMSLDANINPFMKMMVEKPLTNFFNMLADKLQQVN